MKKFKDYLTKEDKLQKAVMDFLRLKYKNLAFWHTPNEGKRSRFERGKAKYLGLVSGVSDIIIICNGQVLALELKIGKNTLTDNQKLFHQKVKANRGFIGIAYSLDEAIKTINLFVRQAKDC